MKEDRPAGARVLIVEDNDDARQMYARYLEHCGFAVSEARDGAEALRKAGRDRPQVIVMDLALPCVDGWEATRRLKARSTTRDTPIVALTGHALAGHEKVARSAGCDAFLAKPCLPDELAAEIRRLLKARKTRVSSRRARDAAGSPRGKRPAKASARSR